jgi:hypothetical protein
MGRVSKKPGEKEERKVDLNGGIRDEGIIVKRGFRPLSSA